MIETFGKLPDGDAVQRISLRNNRLSAAILTYGASLQSLHFTPHPFSLVLGFPKLEDYLDNAYFGAMVGRVANRIGNGRFTLNGQTYQLDRNEGDQQTLHGGSRGIAFRNWQIADHSNAHVTLSIIDRPEHAGFPGNCKITVTYRLTENALIVETEAETDESTLCNIAHHSYFNLSGGSDVLGHTLQIAADQYLPVDRTLIPTGELASVAGTPFDFRTQVPITTSAAEIIDHNYCLSAEYSPACTLHSPASGITMQMETSQPGLQVFTANGISSQQAGHLGTPYRSFCGIALEPQHWPDALNQSNFPDITLKEGETYRETSSFRFSD